MYGLTIWNCCCLWMVGIWHAKIWRVQKIHRVISTISVMGFLLQKTCFKGRFNHEESTELMMLCTVVFLRMVIFIEFNFPQKTEKKYKTSIHFFSLPWEKKKKSTYLVQKGYFGGNSDQFSRHHMPIITALWKTNSLKTTLVFCSSVAK